MINPDNEITLKLSKDAFYAFKLAILTARHEFSKDADKDFMAIWNLFGLLKRMLRREPVKKMNSLKLNIGEMAAVHYIIGANLWKYSHASFEYVTLLSILSQIDQKLT